jgi:transposase
MLEELVEFIQSNPDSRELKRAIAVKMWLKGYKQREIQKSLFVSSGFIEPIWDLLRWDKMENKWDMQAA